MAAVPSREVVLASILKNLSRTDTPMRYVAVEKIRRFLYRMSDTQYEEFLYGLQSFDPKNIDPKAKAAFLADIDKRDDTGVLRTMAETAFESTDLLVYAKSVLTEMLA